MRKPSQALVKAELFVSTLELTTKNAMTVSIYETRTGTKVSSRHLSSSQSGWLSLPVTKTINQLPAREGTSFRFKVFVKERGRNGSAFTRPLQVPRVWLVVYAEAEHEQPFPLLARGEIRGSTDDRRRRDVAPPKMPDINKACRKKDMNITSMDLTSFAKIVFPRYFNAYQCSGNCSVTEKTKFINHSILRALVLKKKGITSVGEPCCVPTKLKSIALIFSTDNGGFVMSTVEDMIVEKCGCSG